MLTDFFQFLLGFSIVAALLLAIAYLFFLADMRKSLSSKVACVLMLAILAALQWMHYRYFSEGFAALESRAYILTLLLTPPVFYLFSRSVLFTDSRISWQQLLHFGWLIPGFLLPPDNAPVIAFLVGGGYTIWFARTVWGLRDQRSNFHLEFFFFVLFALMALFALLLGLALPYMDAAVFYVAYSGSISIAMLLVTGAVLVFPELLNDIMTATSLAYAKTRLASVDVKGAQAELERLINQDDVYQNESLNLNLLAELLQLTPHQLSELINTHYGMSFPRFLRERRVTVAKKLLIEEADSSILAISMMIGFKSQSNFYTAFKESTGLSPGAYRRNKQN